LNIARKTVAQKTSKKHPENIQKKHLENIMQTNTYRLNRRQFVSIATLTGATCDLGLRGLGNTPSPSSPHFSFIVAGDTHYLANKEAPQQMDAKSQEVCGRLVDTFNRLAGTQIPEEAGGGQVHSPLGLIHVGDIIDTGDKNGGVTAEMQTTEWSAVESDFGLNGKDGRLTFPTFEVYGNHDAPHGKGLALDKIVQRNKCRPHVTNVSNNGLHYSWDWGSEDSTKVHFVNLGLIVGSDRHIDRKRRYAAMDSLDFLVSNLRDKVGETGRPIVLTHHIDVARYTQPCDLAVSAESKEWDPCDVHAFYEAVKDYNVVAIFYGHTHVRNVFRWDGQSLDAKQGIHVFNSDNASHFSGPAQAFFYVEWTGSELIVREFQTRDGWQTGSFTPTKWVASLS